MLGRVARAVVFVIGWTQILLCGVLLLGAVAAFAWVAWNQSHAVVISLVVCVAIMGLLVAASR